ncbi:hypothetical protein EYF80_053590 [Liparis tanakae]|uniref:Uncharacterized protein n=1 Tax=Liparis tanakae TaxID=230148 RepID=A0A4Z2F5R3_9TELE|nr:hypothetical protein EYF80_053590 [Liparis tanakae]
MPGFRWDTISCPPGVSLTRLSSTYRDEGCDPPSSRVGDGSLEVVAEHFTLQVHEILRDPQRPPETLKDTQRSLETPRDPQRHPETLRDPGIIRDPQRPPETLRDPHRPSDTFIDPQRSPETSRDPHRPS